MAIRYSGDCEVRMRREGSSYHGVVRAPGGKTARVSLSDRDVARLTRKRRLGEVSEGYDAAAAAFLLLVDRKERLPLDRRGEVIVVRRIFVAPCPS